MARRARVHVLWVASVAMLGLTGCGGGSMTPPPPPNFSLTASPSSLNIGQGGSATSTVTVTPQNGFSASVSLSASGLPNGVTASFNPPSAPTTSILTLTASNTASTGTSTATITGTSGGLTQNATVKSTVQPSNVAVTVSPKLAAVVVTSQTQQFMATVTGSMGNPGVTWSVDGTTNGNATVGTISASGLYTPPATGGPHTITATSVALSSASATASIAVSDLLGVFTYHNDLSRDGANTQEYALTSSTVNTTTFGKLFSCTVDGAAYTQPLWVPSLSIGGGIHNVIFVATQHDSLYAFDADASPCVTYWKVPLLDALHGGTAGETPVVWNDVGFCSGDVYPEVGVTGTPVIDPTTNTIYLVSASEIVGGSSGNCSASSGTFYHRLHALDLATGSEKFNAPVTIAAQVAGTGDGSSGGIVTFNSQLHHQRSGLALSNGTVYVAFAAHEDATPYHGWLLGYDASNVQQQISIFNTTPNGISGADGGIWAGGGAPAVDGGGDVYVSTGNGIFDEGSLMSLQNDYGDSILRLSPVAGNTPNGANLKLEGWFTPYDEFALAHNDTDLGSGAVVLLPDQSSVPTHLLVEVGKDGVVYLIDRDNMGQFQPSDNNQIVQYFNATGGGFWGTPAFWQNNLYFAGAGDTLKQFSFNPTTGKFPCNPQPCSPSPASQSSQGYGFPDASPSLSTQGASSGIVWGIDASLYGANGSVPGPAILHAYNAANLATEYWNSSMASNNRDQAGDAVKFVPPTIANGKVYLGTRTEIDVYGLLPN